MEAATAEGLAALYDALSTEYVEALSSGKPVQAVEEDLLVFLKLHAVGFARLQHTETRHAGPWEVQFNQLRSFRPRRIATQVPQSLHSPFDEAGFHPVVAEVCGAGVVEDREAISGLRYIEEIVADVGGFVVG